MMLASIVLPRPTSSARMARPLMWRSTRWATSIWCGRALIAFASSVISRSKPGTRAIRSASRRSSCQARSVGGAWSRFANASRECSSTDQTSSAGGVGRGRTVGDSGIDTQRVARGPQYISYQLSVPPAGAGRRGARAGRLPLDSLRFAPLRGAPFRTASSTGLRRAGELIILSVNVRYGERRPAAQGRKQPSALASGELPESWLGTVRTALVVVARHEGAALAHEKVEIGAFVRLQHVIEIEAPVAACQRRLGLFPFPAPLREFLLRHEQLELSLRDVELDFVAVRDERERAARRRLGRDVQHHRSVGGAAHARIRYANHVGDAFFQEFRRERHIAHFGHARVALRPAVLQHQ